MLVIDVRSTPQIVLLTLDLMPVARTSQKSFRQLPDAAAVSDSLARLDH